MTFRFFLDANISHTIEKQLSWVFSEHKFRSARTENLEAALDLDLFPELKAREFDAIITQDIMQMSVVAEAESLRQNGLHWIGIKQTGLAGPTGLARLVAAILTAIPHFLADPPVEPTAYHVSLYAPKAPRIALL